jgi:hypothetical protein
MHEKRIDFSSVDSLGNTFAEAIDITPRGGGLEKIAGRKHPEVESFLRTLRPDPKYQYVLMTPMGAYEYWGMNVNGDVFPEISLAHDMFKGDAQAVAKALEDQWLAPFGKRLPPGFYKEFGHKTFLQANRYRHHVNKNPEIAYGDIVLSVWNPAMYRVEVISRHDREKAKRVGAEEIIADLDCGKPRQISMGCKVPFDVCTKCGHISRTPRDYCEHLRYSMGKVNSDGSINGAVNFFPRFFDLSDVFVPAAKESGVLMKVAGVRGTFPLGEKNATALKKAEIKKEVLPNSGEASVSDCADREEDLPRNVLEKGDLGKLLTTLAALGIVLKPHEFQHASLHRMGMGRYSDALDRGGMVFRPRKGMGTFRFSSGGFDSGLAQLLSSFLGSRSAFSPHLGRRIIRIQVVKPMPAEKRAYAPDSEPLTKIAEAYDSYRRAFRTLPSLLDVAMEEAPSYYQNHFFSDLLTDSMEKLSYDRKTISLSESPVTLYLYNAHRGMVSENLPSWETPALHSPARALYTS